MEALLWSLDGLTLYATADRTRHKDLVTIDLDDGEVTYVDDEHSGFSDLEKLAWIGRGFAEAKVSGWQPTDVAEALPAKPLLRQNHPNPLDHVTTIAFELPGSQHVDLAVFDVSGRNVAIRLSSRTVHLQRLRLPEALFMMA